MARRPRRTTTPSGKRALPAGSDSQVEAFNAMLVATLTEKIDREAIYTLSAPQTLPIKQHDGQYRQRPMTAEEEFSFKGCWIGARNQVIFEFQPMDPTKFQQMELEERNVFSALEGFENVACGALGHSGASGLGWTGAKRAWLKNEIRRVATEAEAEDAETAAKKEIDDAYGSNSAFGSW